VDFDDDGKMDVVAGDTNGSVWFFRNVGSHKKPELAEGKQIEADGKPIVGTRRIYEKDEKGKYQLKETIPGSSEAADKYSKLTVADWNGDGLKDMVIGHNKGEFLLYENTGKKGAPQFGQPIVVTPEEDSFPSRPSPYLVDWDGDGIQDLLVGSERGEVYFFSNKGTKDKPRYISGKPLMAANRVIKNGSRARLDIVDWNNDGKLDLLVGDFYYIPSQVEGERGKTGGNIWLYLRE
jgi:hypothetical protein